MRSFSEALYYLALTAWIGGMWVVGYVVAPSLFAGLGDRQQAGLMAGKLFALMGWIGLVCGVYLCTFLVMRFRGLALKRAAFWLALAIMAMTAASLFGIQPLMAQLKAEALPRGVMESVVKDRFAAWHGISSILYLIQSLLGIWLVLAAHRVLGK